MTSEIDFIQWLHSLTPSLLDPEKGIGDDAAILSPPKGKQLIVSTESLVENVHFRREKISPAFLGHKSLLVNLRDLAAMGAEPWTCLLSMVLPEDLVGSDYSSIFFKSFLEETRRWQVNLVGGNLSKGSIIQITVTILGTVPLGQAVRRDTCLEGDSIFVVGRLGYSALGLQQLEELNFEEPPANEEELLKIVHNGKNLSFITNHLLPTPRISEGIWLRNQGLANSMIDISDGLVTDLQRIANSSFVDIVLHNQALEELKSEGGEKIDLQHILNGGEDYALAFSCPKKETYRLRTNYPDNFGRLLRLGEARRTKSPAIWLDKGIHQVILTPEGFDHFK